MKRHPFILAGLAAFSFPALAASDQPARSWRWSNGAAVATEYVWRGQSLTDGKPALVGELKLTHESGVYAGVWAGRLDLGEGTDTSVELDYFLGWAKRFDKLSLNAGYLYRQRPSDVLDLDFEEVVASVSYDFGVARVGVGGYYAWDYFQGGNSLYRYANVRVPVGKPRGVQLLAIASAGHYDFGNRAIGDYGNLDLRLVALRNGWEYSVGYGDTDVDRARSGLLTRDQTGGRWRAQVLVMF